MKKKNNFNDYLEMLDSTSANWDNKEMLKKLNEYGGEKEVKLRLIWQWLKQKKIDNMKSFIYLVTEIMEGYDKQQDDLQYERDAKIRRDDAAMERRAREKMNSDKGYDDDMERERFERSQDYDRSQGGN